MNNKGSNGIKTYIIVFVILLIGLIFIGYFLSSTKKDKNAKPITTSTKKVSTTTSKQVVIDNNKEPNYKDKEEISNFKASLYDIVKNLTFYENYNITTIYHGVSFTFRCNNYDKETLTCIEGSALMKINDSLYPLYTYEIPEDNYLMDSKNYYIVLEDDFVMLANTSRKKNNLLRIYDLSSNTIATGKNIIMSYSDNGENYSNIYPNIDNKNIYYYKCLDNSPSIYQIDLNGDKKEKFFEKVNGSCN